MKVGIKLICSNCGAHLEKDDKFCVNCGQSVFDNPKTKTEHNFNSQDRQCPKCHKVVNVDDKFCINCGHSLQQTLSNSNDNIASHTYSNTKPEIENETADHIRLTEEAKHLFNNTTKSIGRLAGNDESLKLNLRDMFSEVFKSHTKDEADEEFFWSMMDEINEEEDFVVEGPLWIQVHAFEKGVEVTISKSKNEDAMNMSDDDTNHQFDDQVNELLAQTLEGEESLEDLFEQRKQQKKNHQDKQQRRAHKPSNVRNIIVKFDDLEQVIDYAYHNNQNTDEFEDLLYMIDNKYYYSIHFDDSVSQEMINDSYSQLLEFAYPTDKTNIYLNDYAKIIMSHNVTSQVRKYFTDTNE